MLKIKRAYEPPASDDGHRVLVDRIWPRGRSRNELALDEWAKELAPSNALRKFFAHDPERWNEFVWRYRRELEANASAMEKLHALAKRSKKESVTLVYGARDEKHNQAVALKALLRR